MIEIRPERPIDIEAVRSLNQRAYEQGPEAGIVDRLRENCPDVVSLVALDGDQVVSGIRGDLAASAAAPLLQPIR